MPLVIEAPNRVPWTDSRRKIFLAGSIEMGQAIDWQQKAIELFKEQERGYTPRIIVNPRRREWDSSWRQEFTDPQFSQQVNWELDGLERSDYILVFLANETMSPISLLELGTFASQGKMVVVCEEGFKRKGNIDIYCDRYKIPQTDKLDSAIEHINMMLQYSFTTTGTTTRR